MAYLNDNFLKLQAGYLFPEIGRRVAAFAAANPDKAPDIIRCGIGDVTEPLPMASIEAMHRAVAQLAVAPAFLIVDGNRFIPYGTLPYRCIVHGDALYASIAAASVLAKTCRDDFMNELSDRYPAYGWRENKGYPTRQHREAIARYGLTPYHRKTFRQLDTQLKLF